jgi:hypothetical protein
MCWIVRSSKLIDASVDDCKNKVKEHTFLCSLSRARSTAMNFYRLALAIATAYFKVAESFHDFSTISGLCPIVSS